MKRHTNHLPGVMTKTEADLHQTFLHQVELMPGGERISRCIQCGTCTGSCPVSYAMDISPRQLIALFRAGEMEQIMRSRTIWICASCYSCTTRCPSGIKITDMIYALKRTAIDKKMESVAPQVVTLAQLYTENLMSYGRLHEGTLIRKYYMKTNKRKFKDLIPLGRKMWKTKRLEPFPKRIKDQKSLARIILKAQEIEMRHMKEKREYAPEYVGYRGLGEFALEARKGE
ncbi:MAG: 4Fe-4S dicluster domain-containing protein [Ignavibacteriae bacterium]|nr:4Fe-4S dicluster domain-containing protein [Ignavibacteriota bacterium]